MKCTYEPVEIKEDQTTEPSTDVQVRDKIKKLLEVLNSEDFFHDEDYRSYWLMPLVFDTGNRLLSYSAPIYSAPPDRTAGTNS